MLYSISLQSYCILMHFCFKLLMKDLSLGSKIFKLSKYSEYCNAEVARAQIYKEGAQNLPQIGLTLKQWNWNKRTDDLRSISKDINCSVTWRNTNSWKTSLNYGQIRKSCDFSSYWLLFLWCACEAQVCTPLLAEKRRKHGRNTAHHKILHF